ncbi:MAG TPA: phosphodiester glycosidase family protein [Chroococcales cyanobacterium]
MLKLNPFLLLFLLLLLSAPAAAGPTYGIDVSPDETNIAVFAIYPRLLGRTAIPGGMRFDLSTSGRRTFALSRPIEKGPLSSLSIAQKGTRMQVVVRWRFPVSITSSVEGMRLVMNARHDVTHKTKIAVRDGTVFQRIYRWTPAGPEMINVLRLDLRKVSLRPQVAANFNRETVSSIARRWGAIAAINGSFFSMRNGQPIGLLVLDGQIISSSFYNRSVFGIRHDGTCFIDNARLLAAVSLDNGRAFVANGVNQAPGHNRTVLYTHHFGKKTRTKPDPSRREFAIAPDGTVQKVGLGNSEIPEDGYVLSAQGSAIWKLKKFIRIGTRAQVYTNLNGIWKGIRHAIGGGPTLVHEGKVKVTATRERFSSQITRGRAPRSAIGYAGKNQVILVTVDGRQSRSAGMTLYELARLMRDLGAKEAINLDGGGSTTMYLRGHIVNWVSGGSERPVQNALLVTGK